MAVLPQNPSQRGKITDGAANARLFAARLRLYQLWKTQNPADASAAALINLPLTMRSISRLPFHAPWFVDQLLAQQTLTQALKGLSPDDYWLRTTLHLP
ncbi:MAG: hypothetical protein ACP5Q0_06640, partial [Halothiobacillus sp.]